MKQCVQKKMMNEQQSTSSVNILLWVPNAVPTSVQLLRFFEVPISGTLVRLSQYMGTLNSVFSLGMGMTYEGTARGDSPL